MWRTMTLGELCEIARGGSPRPIDEFLTDDPNGINWIKISDATASDKYIYETAEKIRPEGRSRSRYVESGDFLLSNSMSFGRPYILRTSGCIHDGWLVLRQKLGLLDEEYLYYFLSSAEAYAQFDGLASGSTVRNLNSELVKKVRVSFPPLDEQKRIVAILDEAFEGIKIATANAEKNLANAQELFAAELRRSFQQTSDWKQGALGDLVRFIDYRGKTPPKRDAGVRLITAKNVKMGFIRREPEEFIDAAAYDTWMTRGYPAEGDVLFTTEAPLANVALLDTSERVVIGQRLITMQPDEGVLRRRFLKYLLMSPQTQERIYARATGATVKGIKAKWLKQIPIWYPATGLQDSLTDHLDAVSDETGRLAEFYTTRQRAFPALRQSILARAFSGQLTAARERAA